MNSNWFERDYRETGPSWRDWFLACASFVVVLGWLIGILLVCFGGMVMEWIR